MTDALTQEIKDQFIALEGRLSPENLCCDGEIPRSEVRRRYAQIQREWKALERRIGREVEQEGNETRSWWKEKYGW